MPGLLWVGTDDGNIQVSRDGGATWTEVGANIPGGTNRYYVSRVEALPPRRGHRLRVGRRASQRRPAPLRLRHPRLRPELGEHLFESAGIRNVNTVRQDPVNPRLLYAGTEFGFFISLDEGGSWERFMTGLPVVRVDDVVVHPPATETSCSPRTAAVSW